MAMTHHHHALVSPQAAKIWTRRISIRSAAASPSWNRSNSINTAFPSNKHVKLLHLGAGAFTRRLNNLVANGVSVPGYSAAPEDSDDGLKPSDNISVGAVKESAIEINSGPHSVSVRSELILLALPAVLGQAIDPLAQLMETAYIGRLGALELASAGIGVSIFNIVSKIFNIPLLSIATSFVAEDISKNASKHSSSGKLELSSVSSALILAAGIGHAEQFTLCVLHVLAVCLGNLSAVVLLPLLIYGFQLGITGAAISTVASQYIIAVLLLQSLSKRAVLLPPRMDQLEFGGYLKSGESCMLQSHQWQCMLYKSSSYALAVSAQALIASSYAILDYKKVQKITMFALQIGVISGLALAVGLYGSFGNIARLFTSDPEFVCASQPVNALAFIFDGLHYGISDFDYVGQATIVVGIVSSLVLLYAPSVFGLAGVWAGLTTLMGLRMAAGILRLLWKSGPWSFLHNHGGAIN
ncbi:hypothetical protein EJB05_28403 [Eragrostis curvula]|uniref:Protein DETOXIFICATION n=1 Tax=Eragrostis curvula TaxID=38414 RepID=A0A5J9UQP3_9POAL|nr:hypothetical protein EJB05_28403 [Eragrostis curvula]